MSQYEVVPDSLEGTYEPDEYDKDLLLALKHRIASANPNFDSEEIEVWAGKIAISVSHLIAAAEFSSGIDTVFEAGNYQFRFLDVRGNPMVYREICYPPKQQERIN